MSVVVRQSPPADPMRFLYVGYCESCAAPIFVAAADANDLDAMRRALDAADHFVQTGGVVATCSLERWRNMPGFLQHEAHCASERRRRRQS